MIHDIPNESSLAYDSLHLHIGNLTRTNEHQCELHQSTGQPITRELIYILKSQNANPLALNSVQTKIERDFDDAHVCKHARRRSNYSCLMRACSIKRNRSLCVCVCVFNDCCKTECMHSVCALFVVL